MTSGRAVVRLMVRMVRMMPRDDRDGLSSVDIKSETETLRPDSPDDMSE